MFNHVHAEFAPFWAQNFQGLMSQIREFGIQDPIKQRSRKFIYTTTDLIIANKSAVSSVG